MRKIYNTLMLLVKLLCVMGVPMVGMFMLNIIPEIVVACYVISIGVVVPVAFVLAMVYDREGTGRA